MEEFYQRKLPHIQPKGATLFVTFRLHGSLPLAVIEQLKADYETDRLNAPTVSGRYEAGKRYFAKFDDQLHCADGPHYLRQHLLATVVADSLHFRDQRVYRLDVFTIMSNHVHVVFKPLQNGHNFDGTPKYFKLSKIMQSLKRHTARKCNLLLDRQGAFWQAESYDHIVRDTAEWRRIVQYVLYNPVKAGLVSEWQAWPYTYCAYSWSD